MIMFSFADSRIAITAFACKYAGANDAKALWCNVLEGRRSFYSIPNDRLNLSVYDRKVVGEPDSITPILAGLISNWPFDRDRFRIPKGTFASTDLSHWLALDLAAEALELIGGVDKLPKIRTAVIVANTLTGEFSRASSIRMRLPFFQDALAQALNEAAIEGAAAKAAQEHFATFVRQRLASPTEDTLAGSLSNTIAGRIANFFDFGGGAYSIDGACSSSLLAVSNAATLIETEQADAVLVGAVDLSLDPFELVGFSRSGALARGRMRVFDKDSNGFWPGEGGAVLLLTRVGMAARLEIPIRAILSGWGMSTDGAGGLTRPTSEGQLLSFRRAYEKANIDPDDLAYVEAHGTGTAVGDPVEVAALAQLRDNAKSPLPIGSIKANIGHTKAAAGLAGLVKTISALETQLLPPHVGCEVPHPCFRETGDRVCVQSSVMEMSDKVPTAGVSSFGFGGINVHVVLQQASTTKRSEYARQAPAARDSEVFLFSAPDRDTLRESLVLCEAAADRLSLAELTDLAGKLAHQKNSKEQYRAGFQAGDALEFRKRAQIAILELQSTRSGESNGVHLTTTPTDTRIAFLFPGQAAPVRSLSGIWKKRFPESSFHEPIFAVRDGDAETANAQPAIIQANLATLRLLEKLGVTASIAAGHSVGELAALAWGGLTSDREAIALAAERGAIMARYGTPGGGMIRLQATFEDAASIAAQTDCTVACRNGANEFVLAGRKDSIAIVLKEARRRHIEAQTLETSHAFHSSAMDSASPAFARSINDLRLRDPANTVVSSVTGAVVATASEAKSLLSRQLTEPVAFDEVLQKIKSEADIVVEVGPGAGLSRLASIAGIRSLSVDGFGGTLVPLMDSIAELHAIGCDINAEFLYPQCSFRPVELNAPRSFLTNPCNSSNATLSIPVPVLDEAIHIEELASANVLIQSDMSIVDIIRKCVAREAGLDVTGISQDARFLTDLHLNSLTVSRIALMAAVECGVGGLSNPTEFADATPNVLAHALEELLEFPPDTPRERISSAAKWVAPYSMVFEDVVFPLPNRIGQTINFDDAGNFCIVDIKEAFDAEFARELLQRLQSLAHEGKTGVAILHRDLPISGFCRSVMHEHLFSTLLLINVEGASTDDARIRFLLNNAPSGLSEFRLSDSGLQEALFKPCQLARMKASDVRMNSAVLAVGCAKGIGFDCVATFAHQDQQIIFVGRTASTSEDVRAALDNASRLGLRCHYIKADVTKMPDVVNLNTALQALGLSPSALLYAPALNQPTPFLQITEEILDSTLSPKVRGLQNMLEMLGENLDRAIVFGSIIGRVGIEGEAHYALANSMQSRLLEEFHQSKPDCQCLAIEWTVWGTGGMGERLGTIERLESRGIDPISTSDALGVFSDLIESRVTGSVCITSRFGNSPVPLVGRTKIPFLRFIDDVLIDYPGVEIVAETKVSHGSDPYLGEHVINGTSYFPGVMALEAMTQGAACLREPSGIANVSSIRFLRAIGVSQSSSITLRTAVCKKWNGEISAAVFADDDGFVTPFASALFSPHSTFKCPNAPSVPTYLPGMGELYGSLYFGRGRFQRIAKIDALSSRYIAASMKASAEGDWFGAFQHQRLVLGDPGATDALLHALQATIPGDRVVPSAITNLCMAISDPPVRMVARENWARNKEYSFDIWGFAETGETVVYLGDARFRAIASNDWHLAVDSEPALLGPLIERLAHNNFAEQTVSAALFHSPNMDRQQRRRAALHRVGVDYEIAHGGDGRPLLRGSCGYVGLTHCQDFTLAICGSTPMACDIEVFHHFDGERSEVDAADWVASEVARKLNLGRTMLNSTNGEKCKTYDGECSIFRLTFSSHGRQYALAIGFRPIGDEIEQTIQHEANELAKELKHDRQTDAR